MKMIITIDPQNEMCLDFLSHITGKAKEEIAYEIVNNKLEDFRVTYFSEVQAFFKEL